MAVPDRGPAPDRFFCCFSLVSPAVALRIEHAVSRLHYFRALAFGAVRGSFLVENPRERLGRAPAVRRSWLGIRWRGRAGVPVTNLPSPRAQRERPLRDLMARFAPELTYGGDLEPHVPVHSIR